jgi:hypothetical protein
MQQPAQRVIAYVDDRRGGVDPLEETELTAVHVAQPGHGPLIDKGGADWHCSQPRVAQPRERTVNVRLARQQIRAEPREPGMDGQSPRLDQLDRRCIEADAYAVRHLHDRDGARRCSPPSLAGAIGVPRTVHPEVRMQRQATAERHQQVLAARAHLDDLLAHDTMQRRATGAAARCHHHLPDQRLAHNGGNAAHRVALRHALLPI